MEFDVRLDTDQAGAIFQQILDRILSGNLQHEAHVELLIIGVALIFAIGLSWLVNRWVERIRGKLVRGGHVKRGLLNFLLEVRSRMALPLAASIFMLLASAVASNLELTPPLARMPLCRLAQTLFAALASVRIACYSVKQLFGKRFFLSERVVAWIVWGLWLLYLAGALPHMIHWMQSVRIPIGNGKASLWSFTVGLLTVALTMGAAHWLSKIFNAWLKDVKVTSLDETHKIVIQRIAAIVFYGTAVLTALSAAGLDVTVLSVFGGAMGVGLGFGLQKIASNYVSGLIVLLERSVKIGDLIVVSGIRGTVTKMATRYTVISTLNGVENIVPNEMLVSGPVANCSYSNRMTRVTVQACVAYGSDYAKAMAIMVECAKAHPRVVDNPPPSAAVTEMADNAVTLQVGLWISDADKGLTGLRSDILQAIMARFDEEGLDIPFSQLDLRVKDSTSTQA